MRARASNMALQRTRRPRLRSGRSLGSLGSPLNAQPLGGWRWCAARRALALSMIAGLLAASSSACASRSTASNAATQRAVNHRPGVSRSDSALLDTEWRLFSFMFSVLPSDGYPIHFRRDGTVESENLGAVASWRFGEGALELLTKSGQVAYSFRLDPQRGIYYFRLGEGSFAPGVPVLIGPAGFPFGSYRPPENELP